MSGSRRWKTNWGKTWDDRWKPRRRPEPARPDPLTATLNATDQALHAWGATSIRYTFAGDPAGPVVCRVEVTTSCGTVLIGRSEPTSDRPMGYLEAAAVILRNAGEVKNDDALLRR